MAMGLSEDTLQRLSTAEKARRVWEALDIVNLEPAEVLAKIPSELSGGMKKRVGIARAIVGRPEILLWDEPTTGLHFEDIRMLLDVLQRLVKRGNTVLVIEHNLDVIKTADWIVDLGPEGGDDGGLVLAVGTPEEIATVKASYTGSFLNKILNKKGKAA